MNQESPATVPDRTPCTADKAPRGMKIEFPLPFVAPFRLCVSPAVGRLLNLTLRRKAAKEEIQHPNFRIRTGAGRPCHIFLKNASGFLLGLLVGGMACLHGMAQDAPTGLLCDLLSHPEKSLITDSNPDFGWIMNSHRANEVQSAYQILVSSNIGNLKSDQGDMWDSGRVVSNESINVNYAGKPLQPSTSYWWRVRTWDREGDASGYSEPQRFNTGEFNRARSWPGESRWVQIPDESGRLFWTFEDRAPVAYDPVPPVKLIANPDGSTFLDFGRAAFSALNLTLTWKPQNSAASQCIVNIDVGEKNRDNAVDQNPGGGIIHARFPLTLQPGTHSYSVPIPRFKPRYPNSQVLPLRMPEVIPFRYCAVLPGAEHVKVNDARQLALHVQFDDKASSFSSSNAALDKVYDLCKYSVKVNTFNGDYAGSERERMLYEADTYIQQMSHYAIDREYAIGRYSAENMIYHATWPTEWIPHSVFMAYADYLYTGNKKFISQYYDALKPKTLLALAGDNGLVSSRTGLQTPEFAKSIHFPHPLRDIVDWPTGETDGFAFRNVNSVVNAFHYRSLVLMEKIASALDKPVDAAFYRDRADRVKAAFNAAFLDQKRGIYLDGTGTDHSSLHANLFALAFGLVPKDRLGSVVAYIKSRGMACSVYPAIYLLEGLYDSGEDQYALDLMTSDGLRSWLNMIRVGSTVTTEAWDVKFKSNEGWTHAWSTSPVGIIPRKLMGIEPLEPGFSKVLIEPRPGNLKSAKILMPTIRGPITVGFDRGDGLHYFRLNVTIPANMTAQVVLPTLGSTSTAIDCDGHEVTGRIEGNRIWIDSVGSGSHTFAR